MSSSHRHIHVSNSSCNLQTVCSFLQISVTTLLLIEPSFQATTVYSRLCLSLQGLGPRCLSPGTGLPLESHPEILQKRLPVNQPHRWILSQTKANESLQSSHLCFLRETQEAYILEGRQDEEANKLLEPDVPELRGATVQGGRVFPHHLDEPAARLPEGLLKLQEDFIVGPKAHFPDRFCLLGGQWWLKKGVQMFFKKTWNSQVDSTYTMYIS